MIADSTVPASSISCLPEHRGMIVPEYCAVLMFGSHHLRRSACVNVIQQLEFSVPNRFTSSMPTWYWSTSGPCGHLAVEIHLNDNPFSSACDRICFNPSTQFFSRSHRPYIPVPAKQMRFLYPPRPPVDMLGITLDERRMIFGMVPPFVRLISAHCTSRNRCHALQDRPVAGPTSQ